MTTPSSISNTYNIKFSPQTGTSYSLPELKSGEAFSPLPWQGEAICKAERADTLDKKVLIDVATGAGKTVLAQLLLVKWRHLFPLQIMASPRNEVNKQWIKKRSTVYGPWSVSATHQFFGGDESKKRLIQALENRWGNPEGALVTSHATLVAAYNERPDVFDFDTMCFVCDEVHHVGEDTELGKIWRKSAASKGWILGLTGTLPDTLYREVLRLGFTIYRREMYDHLASIGIKQVDSKVFEYTGGSPLETMFNNLHPESTTGALAVYPSEGNFWRGVGSGWEDKQRVVEESYTLGESRGFKRGQIADTIMTLGREREHLLREIKKKGNPQGYKLILTNKYVNEGIDISWLNEVHMLSSVGSYVSSRQIEGRLTRKDEGKNSLTFCYYVPAFCSDPDKLEFYEDRINAGIISSFSEDLMPELTKLRYPRIKPNEEEPEVPDERTVLDEDITTTSLTPREAFGDDVWNKVRAEALVRYILLPFEEQTQEKTKEVIQEAIQEIVKANRITLEISIKDAVDAVYRHTKDAVCREKAKNANMSFEAFLDSLHSSEEFPHLLDQETFMGISHTPDVMKQMHRAYQSHKEREWDDRFEVFKKNPNLVKFVWKKFVQKETKKKRFNKSKYLDKISPERRELISWGKEQQSKLEKGKLNPSQSQRFEDLMKKAEESVLADELKKTQQPNYRVVPTPVMEKIRSEPTPRSFGYR